MIAHMSQPDENHWDSRMSYTRNWGLLVIVLLSLRLTTWIQADEKSFRVPPKEPSEALKSFRLHA